MNSYRKYSNSPLPEHNEMKKCPFLVRSYIFSCTSEGIPYVPSLARLQGSCSSGSHSDCPYFAGKTSKKRELDFGIWEK